MFHWDISTLLATQPHISAHSEPAGIRGRATSEDLQREGRQYNIFQGMHHDSFYITSDENFHLVCVTQYWNLIKSHQDLW